MARIPAYRQQRIPSTNVGAAPRSTSAADIGADAIGSIKKVSDFEISKEGKYKNSEIINEEPKY